MVQGLADKPVVTVWNKLDLAAGRAELMRFEASKRSCTIAVSAVTGEGMDELAEALQRAICSQMDYISTVVAYEHSTVSEHLLSCVQ